MRVVEGLWGSLKTRWGSSGDGGGLSYSVLGRGELDFGSSGVSCLFCVWFC